MTKNYDYIIIGSGPCGLATAYILAQYKQVKNILLIDREINLGGCHRVKRVDNYFTEHGPRLYSDAYINTINLLNKMGIPKKDYFTDYKFTVSNISTGFLKDFTWNETYLFIKEFIKLIFYPSSLKSITCLTFMKNNKFSNKAITLVDRFCRLIGGTDASKYTMYCFLQIVNQLSLHQLYQLKEPSDIGLFKTIKQKLLGTGKIDIVYGEVTKLISSESKITGITINDKENISINGNVILAIPPHNLYTILNNSSPNLSNSFIPFLDRWATSNSYNLYIPIVFHWSNQGIIKSNIYGSPSNDWGIEFVILSDYMMFDKERSKTVLSTSITITDTVSTYLGKTPHECTEEELIKEVFRQLQTKLGHLPNPDKAILYPNIKKVNNYWINIDNAFVSGINYGFPLKSPTISNLYSVGSHISETNIIFTSMEAAIVNSIKLCHTLIPESKKDYKIKSKMTITRMICIILGIIIIAVYFIYYKYFKYH